MTLLYQDLTRSNLAMPVHGPHPWAMCRGWAC